MQECIYHKGLSDKVNQIHVDLQEIRTVRVINGSEKEMPINKAIAEIWEATQFARDRKKIFKIMNKYEKAKHIIKRIIVAIAGLIIVMHIFKGNLGEAIKFLLNLN